MNAHRYILQSYKGPSSRYRCPECGQQRTFTRYIDQQTGECLPDHIGRCDREDKCGYHFTPKQYFEQMGGNRFDEQFTVYKPKRQELVKPVDYLPVEFLEKSMAHHDRNHFTIFLNSLFCETVTRDLIGKYFIGTSKKYWPCATVFWQIDSRGYIRQAKVMDYNPNTGKRIKSDEEGCRVIYAGKSLLNDSNANLQQCFFGEHLLTEYPGNKVAIVESEKTAIIASVFFPKYIWLATGGKNGLRWTDKGVCGVLRNREVILFPDLGAFDQWSKKVQDIKKQVNCNIMVSDVLESIATDAQRAEGLDLVDYLVKRDERAGWALSDFDYPVMWDIKTFN